MATDTDNDFDWVPEFIAGKERALKAAFDELVRPLSFFAQSLIDNKEEAEDIVLDAFNKLWLRHQHFETYANIKAFLYITTKNACLNYLKTYKRRNEIHEELQYLSLDREEEQVLTKMINADLMQMVWKELESLPAQCKEIVHLSYYEGLSNAEIAEKLHTSINNVRVQKTRALQLLRVLLLKKKLLIPAFAWLVLKIT